MYLEKILTEDAVILILIIAVLSVTLLYIKVRLDCSRKEKKIETLRKELEMQASQVEQLTVLYNHVLGFDKSKTDFFTSIAHELKTPVSVILGAIQLLALKTGLQSADNPSLTKNLAIIRTNSFRLLRLVNNILDFARADAGYLKFNPVNCNISHAVEEIVQSVIPYAQQKHISMEFHTDASETVTAVDMEKLERIIMNLLSNAIKFTPEGGKISVSISSSNSTVSISVKDTGIGIPAEKQQDIFKRYIQVNSAASKEQEGSGIGLWLVKAFTELHGGDISLYSEIEKGSQFIVKLPVKVIENAHSCDIINGFHQEKLSQAADIEFTSTTM